MDRVFYVKKIGRIHGVMGKIPIETSDIPCEKILEEVGTNRSRWCTSLGICLNHQNKCSLFPFRVVL